MLFLLRSPAYVRNFETVLRTLADRGHSVTVLFEERKEGGDEAGLALISRLSEEYPSLDYEFLPLLARGPRRRFRMGIQAGQDWLRYFDEPFGDSDNLRARALPFLPDRVERTLASAARRLPRGRRAAAAAARRMDARLGEDRAVRAELERRRPRALVLSPLVQLHSRQAEWVRSARRLGIPTMLCVYSWDSLTSKGLVHVQPDRLAVWNDAQRRDAADLHGVDPDSVVVTGAWPYDHWFEWQPSRSRAELCQQLGLPPEEAIVLYVCSSRFIAERERPAVVRWVDALRRSEDPRVANLNVVVRPHPLNGGEWREPSGLPGVWIFPPGGADPVDEPSRADYFDSIAHADAVVGVNTSALVESTIIGRPVLALPSSEFRSSQEQLPHFRELMGAVRVSDSMAEHVAQLSETLSHPADAARRARFVEEYSRPRGDAPPPTELVAQAIEDLL